MNSPDSTTSYDPYLAFLQAKGVVAASTGIDTVTSAAIHPLLKPHQRALVEWAVHGGRRAIFAAFGLGKTLIQLETCRLILQQTGGRGLIVCPLGVRQEFARDATMIGLQITFVRTTAEALADGLYLTNYESVREGKLDPRGFQVVSLDEAAILRGFGGTKTFRTFMQMFEGTSTYRFVATATPDPNEYIELLAYAAFLGIMDVGEAKTRWFKRDSQKADRLTLHAHKAEEFWLWVSSWAVFLQKPSDLGADYADEGYDLPPLVVHWHEIPTDHSKAAPDRDGQGRMFKDVVFGVSEAAREKRDSLPGRLAKAQEIIAEDPDTHYVLWHDLEAERLALKAAIPLVADVYGTQNVEEREQRVIDFAEGRLQYMAGKPVMFGAGVNWQRHCHRAIFLGIGFKFNEFIQACHRIHRFQQPHQVRIDLIYTEAERSVRKRLETKWERYQRQADSMSTLIRQHGLAAIWQVAGLRRSLGIDRQEAQGTHYTLVNYDSVLETRQMADSSVHLILTSIPFSSQYEYTPSYHDFGHSDDNAHFWCQMDFLTPELFRVLQPGRVACIHVKDRIAPGGFTGLGFQTLQPFHAEAIFHYLKHGFAFIGMKTITTDVVRENNQTYRLGWSEQCKDASRMGCGVPEYLLLFRKPPTDATNGYADMPIVKHKPQTEFPDGHIGPYDYDGGKSVPGTGYSRARWQLDAHAYSRSDGNRFLTPDELQALPHERLYKLWKRESETTLYNFARHVGLGELLERDKRLPTTFMLMPPHSLHPDVWTDIARMRNMNMLQERRGLEMHLCPLQFDIVERLIVQLSMPGEIVYDPFSGLHTVPWMAVKLGRYGRGCELNTRYHADGVKYCVEMEQQRDVPTLFDFLVMEEEGSHEETEASPH
jgi:DNA methylase